MGKDAGPCFTSRQELEHPREGDQARVLHCVVLLPGDALIATLGSGQGDAERPEHVTAFFERTLSVVPVEARAGGLEGHLEATREADGKLRRQSKAC